MWRRRYHMAPARTHMPTNHASQLAAQQFYGMPEELPAD
jgi:hypothetical protein